jgi:hypothetical protein
MAMFHAPKQWPLTKNETVTSFESWKGNFEYLLTIDPNFYAFLGQTWEKWSKTRPLRGFSDDGPGQFSKTAQQKAALLNLLLGQIANYCPVISRNNIIRNSTSLSHVWQIIRSHYGFQSSGARILDFSLFKLQCDEKYEDLFQRLSSFFQDNLLSPESGVTHNGEAVDEETTPFMENITVVLWLQMIHPELPALVKQRYGTELRNKSIASLKPEISHALDTLVDELRSADEGRAMRTFSPKKKKFCVLCKAESRVYDDHYLRDCKYLPANDKRQFKNAPSRSRRVAHDACDEENPSDDDDVHNDEDVSDEEATPVGISPASRRVGVIQSPTLAVFYKSTPVILTLDTGATTNMVKYDFVKRIGLPVTKANQLARQADGVTPLTVRGEIHCTLSRDQHKFVLDALVVDQLDCDVLAGTLFMVDNDIAVRPSKKKIIIDGCETIEYGTKSSRTPKARRAQSVLLRAPSRNTVVLPGDFIELTVPEDAKPDSTYALEPRYDSPVNHNRKSAWPYHQEVTAVGSSVRVVNTTAEPILVKRNEHICQIRAISPVDHDHTSPDTPRHTAIKCPGPYSDNIALDPDCTLDEDDLQAFKTMNSKYDDVFNPSVGRYNGASGPMQAVVNIGPTLPPQRKGRMPHYCRDKLIELQQKFDDLEDAGVFAKPEDVGVNVEYLNLSFLVQKPSGGTRLVTSFGEVANYCKPQPSLMPSVDGVLRDIATWKYLIVTDLLQSFYQIPLSKSSMKYCGVSTPYKGIRVYTRSAMGMPGSETALEELMCRVLGHLVQEGRVCKLADDLYVGGQTTKELLHNWSLVLKALHDNGLRLSAKKTKICPRTCTILGWLWSQGTLQASPHRIASLSAATPPETVHGLRSFIGAYKVLSRVLPHHAAVIHPLDLAVAGRQSREKLTWTEELTTAFQRAQTHLQSKKTIHLPRRDDILWIVTDGSVKNCGIGATLYILRDDVLRLAGFFSAKLRKHQVNWLPCEIEALCIGASVQHFAPYIIQSAQCPQVVTDSKPCVQAYHKLQRGEFSSSSRVTTFLSILSRYQAQLQHISGASNLPSDFASRNPQECEHRSCQICKFISELEDSVVREISVKDVEDGKFKMPFTERPAWSSTQQECKDLRRTHAHLTQGTRPTKKATMIKDVKRYLQVASVARDGLLVVQETSPFSQQRERIIVPKAVQDGLLTALHLQFQHPSKHQLKLVFNRYFYALDTDKTVERITNACNHCMSVKTIPAQFREQSTSVPENIGSNFAADVMRRCKQYIFVLRETVSAFTTSIIIQDETHQTLRNALIEMSSRLSVPKLSQITVRVDPAPGFYALRNDKDLLAHGITLDVGDAKNVNKNPVAEHAIQELSNAILNICPDGGQISSISLAIATGIINSRIRTHGFSANEIWTGRDQISKDQLKFDDHEIILAQYQRRTDNHVPSAKSKARGKTTAPNVKLKSGDLVYLAYDRDKHKSRSLYIVVTVAEPWCNVRKFTQTQFRSRLYRVRVNECFLASPQASPAVEPDDLDDDIHETDDFKEACKDTVTEHNTEPVNRPLTTPPAIADAPTEPDLPRPQRARKPPAWINEDWDLT